MRDTTSNSEELRARFAEAFQSTTDPLRAHESTFDELNADPFELFVTEALPTGDLAEETIVQYRVVYRQWCDYMNRVGRHPACPNDAHVHGFAEWLQAERDNRSVATINQKLHKLDRAFRFWQREPALPHTRGYNPFALAREKIEWDGFEDSGDKSPPYIPLQELRTILASIPDIRDQIPILTQLKLGLRVGELRNIQLQDLNLQAQAPRRQYPELGTHECIQDRPNAIYIPGSDERDGNKSRASRILPIDDELQRAFARYLRVRPTWIHRWLFVSKGDGRIDPHAVNDAWKDAFHPEYAETKDHRAITSHFGRHYFTSYWRKEMELSRELVQYMRGDRIGKPDHADSWMHHYLHVYYDDIRECYREGIYIFGIGDSVKIR